MSEKVFGECLWMMFAFAQTVERYYGICFGKMIVFAWFYFGTEGGKSERKAKKKAKIVKRNRNIFKPYESGAPQEAVPKTFVNFTVAPAKP